jgi:predicted MFS family arabinose efflux permease
VNSLLPSVFNAGISLGTVLGGFVIAHYGIHSVIWASVLPLSLAWGLSFVRSGKKRQVAEPALAMEAAA